MKACLLLLRYRSFVKYEIESVCSKESLLGEVEMFARQILNHESDRVGEPDVQDTEIVLGSAIDSIGASKKEILWNRPRGLYPTQSYPAHSTNFLPNRFREPSFFEMGKVLPLSQLSTKWRGPFYSMCVENLHSSCLYTTKERVRLRKSCWFDICRLILVCLPKTIRVGYCRWVLLCFCSIFWPLPLTEHHANIWRAVHGVY